MEGVEGVIIGWEILFNLGVYIMFFVIGEEGWENILFLRIGDNSVILDRGLGGGEVRGERGEEVVVRVLGVEDR